MDCLDAKQKLEPCARGELGPSDQSELERHIATCEGCRLELELTRAVLASSPGDGGADPVPLDPVPTVPTRLDGASSFDPVSIEPNIEHERLPELPPEGPGPARVMTSQLPEEPEELDLSSIHPAAALDPGAIDLPHPEPQAFHEEDRPARGTPEVSAPEAESLSFGDFGGPDAPIPVKAAPLAHAPGSGATPTWDFEPVDVPRVTAPPQESLSFAKEALDRKRGKALKSRRGARLLLWIGGAVCGVGLLGASVWMALAYRDVPAGVEPANLPAVVPPPGTQPQPAPVDSIAPGSGAIPGITAMDAGTASGGAPSVIKAGAAEPGGLSGISPSNHGAARPFPSSQPGPVRASGPLPAPPTKGSPVTSRKEPGPVVFRDDELAPAPHRAPPILTVEPDAPPGSSSGYETGPNPAPSQPQAPTKPISTAPIFVPPASATQASPGTSPKQPATSGPIGRLHQATATAEKNRDLDALRKLREPWKTMIHSVTGADRARAKREYADCLWAIQVITTRNDDRKEALAAYREYVLYAPAGGADARTVSRMRHLEDILSDPQ